MNRDQLEGRWEQLKGQARERWGQLSHDDLERVKGRYQTLAGAIQETYGITREAAEKEIDEFIRSA